MDPDGQTRLLRLLVVLVLLIALSWLDTLLGPLEHDPGARAALIASRRQDKSLEGQEERKKRAAGHNNVHEYSNIYLEDEEDEEGTPSFAKSLKAKSRWYVQTPMFHFDLYSCLPRFVCEVHAQASQADLSRLELDIINLFRNYLPLEGPDSPVYKYQLAAHMGQLATGLEPSPCYSIYPSCPLSRVQVIEALRSVKTSRKMFS
ncbi:uncharacterized protein [Procambarus clarkii]|uniref:uncharacterized protein n=1 Tax=Procambarus clarkii TaxID=6728 RepID=UPI001E675A4D|nr:uncharacterized protein LOC123771670 [Procambarus clarkii]XP_045620259.1 uncharacterized protein LOC123771670 [Procambarus clarkii]XP_045620260.1 uncharacterized protein LOC123771670 [Procambarus clarkii]